MALICPNCGAADAQVMTDKARCMVCSTEFLERSDEEEEPTKPSKGKKPAKPEEVADEQGDGAEE